MTIPYASMTNKLRKTTIDGLRDGGMVPDPLPVGSPEAQAAVQRVMAILADPKARKRRQRTVPIGKTVRR